MASTTIAACSASPLEYHLHCYNGLRHYYRVRNSQIVGGRDTDPAHTRFGPTSRTMNAASVNDVDDECPDTSDWATADKRNSDYICAEHVAMEVGKQLTVKYPVLRHNGTQGQDATDSGNINKVVKYKIISSKNLQNKDETDYYLKIEVDAPKFKYIIAHVCVTSGYLSILHKTWTTST